MRNRTRLSRRPMRKCVSRPVASVPSWFPSGTRHRFEQSALNVLAATKTEASGMFGDRTKLNPIDHLLGVPSINDGQTPNILTAREVPVDGFWSITVYNANGLMDLRFVERDVELDLNTRQEPTSSLLTDPRAHRGIEHRQGHAAVAQHTVVKGPPVEAGTELRLGELAQAADFQHPQHV